MDIKIILTEGLLNIIFDQESKKIVGTCLKRIEIPLEVKIKEGKDQVLNKEDLENLKAQIKNLIYESLHNIKDILILNGKEGINLKNKHES